VEFLEVRGGEKAEAGRQLWRRRQAGSRTLPLDAEWGRAGDSWGLTNTRLNTGTGEVKVPKLRLLDDMRQFVRKQPPAGMGGRPILI